MSNFKNDTIEYMKKVPRLLEKFIPSNYQIELEINRSERIFYGDIKITGQKNTNDAISLHAKDLNIKSIKVNGENSNFSFGEFDELIIEDAHENNASVEVIIKYDGKITDAMHGMYPCYFTHDGVKKELIATQFESHHAREVFPCIDEPAAKATFDLALITEKTTVLGNMPVKSIQEFDKNQKTIFETTPKMSSYLLAFVVGELQKKSTKTKDGVEVNVWSTKAQSLDSLDFALDIAKRSIEFFNDYFGTPYPLSKSDQVALPDFSSGAMENWGLVTYREVALLADPKTCSLSDKRYIATVIAHELSHQWFGNLVTMKWWNDLWLNESFASIIEYVAVDALEPSWKVWLDFASNDAIAALKRDMLAGVQSVQTDVNHPDEISMLFDGAIVYSKGARLIQMLLKYIGEENFKAGLKNYFKKFAYSNTEANDLWNELSAVSGHDIAGFMNKWITQPGYPILDVLVDGENIHVSQSKINSDDSMITWPIPTNSNLNNLPKLLTDKEAVYKNVSQDILFNVGDVAHYITKYDPKITKNINAKLKNKSFDAITRLQLLFETIILAEVGQISSAKIIELLKNYADENNESVLDIVSYGINYLKKFVSSDDIAEKGLKKLAKQLAISEYNRLGWAQKENESEEDTRLRSLIIAMMSYSDDQNTIETAKSIYDNNDFNDIDPEIRHIVCSIKLKDEKDINVIRELVEKYKKTDSINIKSDFRAGLTSTKSPEIAEFLLEKTTDADYIRPQDCAHWIIALIRNKYTRSTTWKWVRNNWSWIEKTFSGDKSYDDYPRYAATALSTRQELDEYKEFFLPMLSIPSLTRVINMGINEITDRINLIERDKQMVSEALKNI